MLGWLKVNKMLRTGVWYVSSVNRSFYVEGMYFVYVCVFPSKVLILCSVYANTVSGSVLTFILIDSILYSILHYVLAGHVNWPVA